MRTLAEDESDPGLWSDLARAVNTAADAVYLLTRAVGYPRCKERDEAVAYAAYQLDQRVQETKDLFNKLLDEVRTAPLEEDESDRKINVVG
jgi:hypothetical protein